ncbi:hypothetical protein [Kribbella sp. CA-293567]|uniref:hypothetical protein n=1 Tax=Kribbella sp. CA-293567 TaxID=3002436 RepID=UPI0022DE0835|nr:hypothetical protein [Kribbella sp. CA-293567]WBQ01829.1 hypothetical protein OX958_17680 [Kribbella sp. CA-293567]
MDVMPSRTEVFLLTEDERDLVRDGAALVSPDGTRQDIPPKVHEVMAFVEAALRQGYALQITPLRQEVPVDQAADAISMSRRQFRQHVGKGEIPFRTSEYVDWVKLSDVLAFDARLKAQREEALQALADEEPWDDEPPTVR